MRRAGVGIATLIAVLLVLGTGYRLAVLHTANTAVPAPNAAKPERRPLVGVSASVSTRPFFSEGGLGSTGYFAELFSQLPLLGQAWEIVPIGEADALAALRAGSLDAALVPVTTIEGVGVLVALSEPLFESQLSLFASEVFSAPQQLGELSIGYWGPQALRIALDRLGANALAVTSPEECLQKVVSSELAACAMDEEIGRASARQLHLSEKLVLVGEPLGKVRYVLACRSRDEPLCAAMLGWAESVRRSGVLEPLRRKWVGERLREGASSREEVALLPWGLSAAALCAVAGVGARHRRLARAHSLQRRQVRQCQELWLTTMDTVHEAVLVLDAARGEILQANPAAESLLGYDTAMLTRMLFGQLLPARHARAWEQWLGQARSGQPVALELPLVRADGAIISGRVTLRAVEERRGPALICTVEDLSKTASLRQELVLAQETLEVLLRHSTDAVVAVDDAGYVTLLNEAARALLLRGVGQEPVQNASHINEVVRVRGQNLAGVLSEVLTAREARSFATTLVGTSGEEMAASITVAPLQPESFEQPVGALLVISPDAQQMLPEQDLQRLRTLSALGQVAGSLAHEIRSRVTGIHVGIQYFSEKLAKSDAARGSMEAILAETERVLEIVENVLTLIRPNKVQRRQCSAVEIFDRVVQSQAKQAEANGVELLASVSPDTPTLFVDPALLERALVNLVKNAVEAMPNGGRVQLAISPARRRSGGFAGGVQIRVSDNGPGIPPAVMGRLFQPFVSEKRGGTGLGLAIARQIVEEHGGTIEVQTQPGAGTTFTIALPS